MKAPDKIYIQIDDTINFISQVFTRKPVDGTYFRDVEYICKNVLLERLQKIRAIPHENAIARDLAFQEVVNELNSI